MRRILTTISICALMATGAHADWTISRPDDLTRDDGVEADLRDVGFIDDHRGWAVGSGATLVTTDGGETWGQQALPERPQQETQRPFRGGGPHPFTVVMTPGDETVVLAGGNTVVVTTDGGKTWAYGNTGTRNRLTGGVFKSAEVGLLVGDNGTIVRTTNGGKDWESVLQGERARVGDNRTIYEAIAFPTPEIGWIVGSTGTTLMSADGGDNWDTPDADVDAVESLYSIVFTSPEEGWIVGQEATLLHTTDNGATWERVENDAEGDWYNLNDIAFSPTDPKNAWIVGDFGATLVTTDGGGTWNGVESNVSQKLYAVAATPSGAALAVGEWGVILRYEPGQVAGK